MKYYLLYEVKRTGNNPQLQAMMVEMEQFKGMLIEKSDHTRLEELLKKVCREMDGAMPSNRRVDIVAYPESLELVMGEKEYASITYLPVLGTVHFATDRDEKGGIR